MRPGRLDRILYIGPPDLSGREEILKIRMKSMTVETGIDVRAIAELVRYPPAGLECGDEFDHYIRQKAVQAQKSQLYAKKRPYSPCREI